MKTFRTTIPNITLRYLEFAGSGVPLLMIHGLGCASSFEYPHVAGSPALSGRHVILLDLLGFGFSDQPDEFGYRVGDHALQLQGLVQARGVERIDIYGHSMGGSIAIELADLLGDRVQHLILSEANLDSGGGEFSRRIAAFDEAEYVGQGHHRVCAEAVAGGYPEWEVTMRIASPLAVHRGATSLVAGSSPDWRSRFLRHPARKSFIFGARSQPDPDAEILASQGVRVLVVPDAGHGMGLDNPRALAERIAEASMDEAERP